ncbi:putative transporter MCH4 [Grifola frondosa]|uniref:Putative transporter MCH4 n=1 Tax=Grifola frondosa TaxID=5627 RepID=A0A1C7MC69_GRIFR|nr:putative transporter MCH4 [Grifola frondosa]
MSTTLMQQNSVPSVKLVDLRNQDDGVDYPDEGFPAWLTVFGAFLALFCSFGQLNAFGTYQSWYATHQLQHLHPSAIAWIGSIQLCVFFVSGGFIGRIFDTHGPRIIMALGTVVYVSSIMLTSLAGTYYQYIITQGILFGLGVGMLFYPPLAAISTHFSKYRATALGIAMVGSGIGGTVYPILLQKLFIHIGFAWGVRVSGFICLALCAVATGTVTSRLSPKRCPTQSPWLDVKTFKDTQFVLLVIGSCFISLGLFIPFFYIVSYGLDIGVSPNTAFYVLAVLNAGSVLGRIAPALVADAFGRFTLLVPCAFMAGLSSLVIWTFARSLPSLMLYAALYGLFSGAFNALIVPCIAQVSDIREIGVRIGILYSVISFPSLLSGPTAGALLTLAHGSYTGLIVLNGATVIIGSLFLLWSKLKINPSIFARV